MWPYIMQTQAPAGGRCDIMNLTLCEIIPLRSFNFVRRASKVLKMCMLNYIYNIFPRHLHVHQRKGLVKITFPSPFQYLNDSPSKPSSSLKVFFRTVFSYYCFMISFMATMQCTDNLYLEKVSQ